MFENLAQSIKLRPKALIKPLPVFCAIVSAYALYMWLHPQKLPFDLDKFNANTDRIYSAAFTFLVAFWGACLTVWGLLKSRATRYVERLSDNAVFHRFVNQYERRLVYALLMIIATFYVYVAQQGMEFTDWSGTFVLGWSVMFACAVAGMADSLYTARSLLS